MRPVRGRSIRDALLHDAENIARVHVEAWRETYCGVLPESNSQGALERRKDLWSSYLRLDPRPGRMPDDANLVELRMVR